MSDEKLSINEILVKFKEYAEMDKWNLKEMTSYTRFILSNYRYLLDYIDELEALNQENKSKNK